MTDATFTFRVDEALKADFTAMAKERDETAAQMLRRMMRDAVSKHREEVAHERWLRQEIEDAMRDADDAGTPRLACDVTEDQWRRQRSEFQRRDDS